MFVLELAVGIEISFPNVLLSVLVFVPIVAPVLVVILALLLAFFVATTISFTPFTVSFVFGITHDSVLTPHATLSSADLVVAVDDSAGTDLTAGLSSKYTVATFAVGATLVAHNLRKCFQRL